MAEQQVCTEHHKTITFFFKKVFHFFPWLLAAIDNGGTTGLSSMGESKRVNHTYINLYASQNL